ncbi:MAG TPA: LPS assembly lipoprotein LptE [Ideonella sp.]|nr:LPS assembly lipoprotein LptE [Ideonella sp.]
MAAHQQQRRALLRGLAALPALAVAGGLAGCGFHLRRPAELPFTRLALTGFKPRSPMLAELRRALPDSVRVMEQPKDAEVVLAVKEDRFEKTVAASTSAGQVREFRLRVSLRFQLTRPDGVVLVADTELEQSRDMTYTETDALAKGTEEEVLVHEMRADIARQLLQMLSSAGQRA